MYYPDTSARSAKRKRWVRVAAVYAMFAWALAGWASSDEPLGGSLYSSAGALMALGYLDTTPPTSVGYGVLADRFDFSSARASASAAGKLVTGISTTSALSTALSTATAGTYIELASGTLSIGAVTLPVSGTAANPIVIAGVAGNIPNLPTVINKTASSLFTAAGKSGYVIGRIRIQGGSGTVASLTTCTDIRLTQLHTHNITRVESLGLITLLRGCQRIRADHCYFYGDAVKDGAGDWLYAHYWYDYGDETDKNNNVWNKDLTVNYNTFYGRSYGTMVWVYQGDWWRDSLEQRQGNLDGTNMARRASNTTIEYNFFDTVGTNIDGCITYKRDQVYVRFNYFKNGRANGIIHWRDSNNSEFSYNFVSGTNSSTSNSNVLETQGIGGKVLGNIFDMRTAAIRTIITVLNNHGWRDLYIGGVRDKWGYVLETADLVIAHNTLLSQDRSIYNSTANSGELIRIHFETAGGVTLVVQEIAGLVPFLPPSQFPAGTARPTWQASRVKIFNNIFAIYKSATGSTANVRCIHEVNPNVSISQCEIYNNLYYVEGTATYGNGHDKYETEGIYGNPLLDLATFTPTAGSPARNAGANTVAVPYDYYGEVFASPRTIGAVSTNTAVAGPIVYSAPSPSRIAINGGVAASAATPKVSSSPSPGLFTFNGKSALSLRGGLYYTSAGLLSLNGGAMSTTKGGLQPSYLELLGGTLSGQTVDWSAVAVTTDQWTEL